MCLFADDVSTRVASRKAGLVSGAVGKSRYLGLKTLIKLMVSPNGPDFSHRRRSIPAPRASAPGEIVRHSCFVTAWVRGDPETGNASGEVVVSAVSGESGDDSRDACTKKC